MNRGTFLRGLLSAPALLIPASLAGDDHRTIDGKELTGGLTLVGDSITIQNCHFDNSGAQPDKYAIIVHPKQA